MTSPSEKQVAILNKYHKPIPATIAEASQIISGLFGKKDEKKEAPKQESSSFKDACDAVVKYVEVCKLVGYPSQYWALNTVFNTERMKRK